MAQFRGGVLANGGQGIATLLLVLVPTESVPDRLAAPIGLTTLVGALGPALAGQVAEGFGLAPLRCGSPCWLANGPLWVTFPD
jgi:hypothetical protein